MLDCVVYISSVANVKKHSRKEQCLESFATGVAAAGGRVHVERDYVYTPSRLAVMLGWATTNTGGRNIALRKQIIAEQQRRGFKTMCIDASCFKYLDQSGTYLRYSLGGPFYDRAEYANRNSDPTKWQEIQHNLNIKIKPAQSRDGYILVGMQRDGGFSMKALNPLNWLGNKIHEIRKYTNRAIVVRPHPGKFDMKEFAPFQNKLNVRVIDPTESTLLENLQGAHSSVFFNSSASVAAVLEGVPVFVDDASAVTWSVAHHTVSQIESSRAFEREQWLWDLASAHWSDEDAQAGHIWKKFLPYLTSTTTS